jgi:hypothetical protein
MTTGIEVGSRVKVVYHPIGSTGQIADSVTLLGPAPLSARPPAYGSKGGGDAQAAQAPAAEPVDAGAAPGYGRSPESGSDPDEPSPNAGGRLPATASTFPRWGLLGLAAFAGGLYLRALERRRS